MTIVQPLLSIENFSLLMVLFTFGIGATATLAPQLMSKNFGIESTTDKTLPWVVSVGMRDVFMGLVIVILYSSQLWVEMAWAHFALAVVAISDFIVVYRHGNRLFCLTHLAGAIAVIAYGAILLSIHS